MLPRRLRRLPCVSLAAPLEGHDIRRAQDPLARLIGLAGLHALPQNVGLLLPRTGSIHTFGMRFALDLLWLDRDGRVVRADRDVVPCRFRSCSGAHAVVEVPARRGIGRACDDAARQSVRYTG